MKSRVIFLCALILPAFCANPNSVLNSMSAHIGTVVSECRREVRFGNEILRAFKTFWSPYRVFNNTEMGCVLSCVIKKLDLVYESGHLKKNNLVAFLRANGADPTVESTLMELIELCITAAYEIRPKDLCVIGFDILKCFRYGIVRLNWQPVRGLGSDEEYDV